ncbi:VOC family protein [Rhodospirillaceae bacterium KN72]|uniref:VOC family protein n=1 Tax=Pacificispira spongiicola TaxID=2729598 RepID=A0A7Y0E1L5_9PROT|nr:VOC family protein [Pacificispira spongiicola]NMM45565.1 VOC family protein [Pacificispira spongiicola]
MTRTQIYLPDRGIDHLVLAVSNLDRAAETYETLGFTVTPRAIHPWGTSNRLVQLQGSFLEIIEVAEPENLFPHGPRSFSFGTYLDSYLKSREGLAMLVFESRDAQADRDQFAERGLPDLDRFDFERQAILPDGEKVRVAFSLAFVPPPETPEAVFFTCQQHAPEYFWKPAYQTHANGAQTVEEVVMIADDPASLSDLFGKMQVPEAVTLDAEGLTCETMRGRVRVLTPAAYHDWYGTGAMPNSPATPHFAAMRISVTDLSAMERRLTGAGIETMWARAGLIVPGTGLYGCALAFAQV